MGLAFLILLVASSVILTTVFLFINYKAVKEGAPTLRELVFSKIKEEKGVKLIADKSVLLIEDCAGCLDRISTITLMDNIVKKN